MRDTSAIQVMPQHKRRYVDDYVTQVYMCANAWGDVNYSRVASVCMHKNKTKFERHDKERFDQYLADVEAGKKKIASGALKPHELVQQAMKSSHTWYVAAALKTLKMASVLQQSPVHADGQESCM